MDITEWAKKDGVVHYSLRGDSRTVCDRPKLGNNYTKHLLVSERRVCSQCVRLLQDTSLMLDIDPTGLNHRGLPAERALREYI